VSPSDAELQAALQQCLSDNASSTSLVDLHRTSSENASTYPLEELTLLLDDGTRLEVIFKDLSPQAVSDSRCHAKPDFLRDPQREIDAYRLLSKIPQFAMAGYCGTMVDIERERYWLFLEKVRAEELYKIGAFEAWKDVSRWLARMHGVGDRPRMEARSDRWIAYDAAYFRIWPTRALKFRFSSASPLRSTQRQRFAELAENYEVVVERLAALPVAFIHGEFYASNVLVSDGPSERRICPIDWEMAGIGPGLLDLAALISGRWAAAQREEMTLAYFDALDDTSRSAFATSQAFLDAVNDCRLHVALQWLGWSSDWIAPPDHAHDWFNDALQLGEQVGCL